MKTVKRNVVVIVGPTSSGKTNLAVRLARRFGGEIVSADSRQVYRGMDIGTGKDLDDYIVRRQMAAGKWQLARVPYHLIDVISPKRQFTVADYQRLAYRAIDDILSRGRLPIVCGGTGLYVAALTEGYVLPESRMATGNWQLVRKRLDRVSLQQLLARLKKVDPKTYRVIDEKNRRRVQRALEIYYLTGKPKSAQLKRVKPPYNFLILGVTAPKAELHRRITVRLQQRLDQGMVQEVKRLRRHNVSWQRLDDLGLEYRFVSRYLRGQLSYSAMVAKLEKAIQQFAKRQMTWFKRDKNIQWITTSSQATAAVKRFTPYLLKKG